MSGSRERTEPETGEAKPMRDARTMEPRLPTGDETGVGFSKIRSQLRIVFWLVSASLVMTAAIFVAVFWFGKPI